MSAPEPTARLMLLALRQFEAELQRRLQAGGFEDVHVAHTNLLRHLNPEGMRLSALASDAGLTKQAVGQSIRALEARDLVQVVPDPDDRRAKRAVYTDRGRALVALSIEHIVDIEAIWSDRLGSETYAALRASLAELGSPFDSPPRR